VTYGVKPAIKQKRAKQTSDISESFGHLDHATQAIVLSLIRHLARQARRR
jgi:hypothetical protein